LTLRTAKFLLKPAGASGVAWVLRGLAAGTSRRLHVCVPSIRTIAGQSLDNSYSSLVPANTADVVLGRNDAKPEARAELGLIDAAKPIGWDGKLVGACVAMGMVMRWLAMREVGHGQGQRER
jgi:hypothetical protein